MLTSTDFFLNYFDFPIAQVQFLIFNISVFPQYVYGYVHNVASVIYVRFSRLKITSSTGISAVERRVYCDASRERAEALHSSLKKRMAPLVRFMFLIWSQKSKWRDFLLVHYWNLEAEVEATRSKTHFIQNYKFCVMKHHQYEPKFNCYLSRSRGREFWKYYIFWFAKNLRRLFFFLVNLMFGLGESWKGTIQLMSIPQIALSRTTSCILKS